MGLPMSLSSLLAVPRDRNPRGWRSDPGEAVRGECASLGCERMER